MVEDFVEIGKRRIGCRGASQAVFGPYRPHLRFGDEFAARGGSFRGGDGGPFVSGERDGGFFIVTGQAEDNAGDVILRGGRQITGSFKRPIEQSGHC